MKEIYIVLILLNHTKIVNNNFNGYIIYIYILSYKNLHI